LHDVLSDDLLPSSLGAASSAEEGRLVQEPLTLPVDIVAVELGRETRHARPLALPEGAFFRSSLTLAGLAGSTTGASGDSGTRRAAMDLERGRSRNQMELNWIAIRRWSIIG
jgi:hypothetical protein